MADPIHNWSDGYRAIHARAVDLRGLDDDRVPRATNGDVIDIAAVLAPAIAVHAIQFGKDGLGLRWRELLHDIETTALVDDPKHGYTSNADLWPVVEQLCAYLDDVPVPELWSSLAEHLGGKTLRNSGPKDDGPFARFEARTYDDLWAAQRDYLAERRGFDTPNPPPGFGLKGLKIPRSTNQDVLQLATYWSDQLAKAKQVMGYQGAVDKWKVALADVDRFAKTGKPDAVYAKNNELWHTSYDVAVQIAIGDETPSKWDMFVGSLKDSVTHLPETLEHAASKGVDLVASAAHAAGRVANEAGRGLFAGFGAPVLIGAGLIGLYFITRSHDHAEG